MSQIGARQVIKAPKTAAGIRTVTFPEWLVPEVEQHFATFGELGGLRRVFVGPYGVTPARTNFSKIWARALKDAGLAGIHIHDLRHTGNHLAAISGASTRELMARMGHASVDAALVYQHRSDSRDRVIAESLNAMIKTARPANSRRSGHVEGTHTG
ncbi:tyrosine-type recombinase/integrase [Microlunatus parietis]|uniref:Integrase n=1 Tax=Microlunatus parietis TaxID=682979 RepID=A0A7Y9I935_9ACTN|nr:tyrosine-type recombinase/integrase [Microlunatus parietis]NYE72596.1 integrase [Microlunatus parietis]